MTIGISIPELKLSRRNLICLLHKLDMQGSARSIIKPCGDIDVLVVAEDDEMHYNRPPGAMHPETEAFIADFEAWRATRNERS